MRDGHRDLERVLDRAWTLVEHAEPEAARQLLQAALARSSVSRGEEADLRHALGAALEDLGDESGRAEQWLRVHRLDAAADEPRPRLSPGEFEELAERALAELPAQLRERLGGVAILVDDRPTEAMVGDGIDPRILGLYTGVPFPDQSVLGASAHPEVIHLFQRNLEAETADLDELREQIRITVLHETAHYFGLDDDDLARLGLA